MEIRNAKVEWMDKSDNEPKLQILVDRIPTITEMRFHYQPIEPEIGIYYGEKNGYVRYFYESLRSPTGSGGVSFHLPMWDNRSAYVVGPWTSRAGVVNALTPLNIVDVSIIDDEQGFHRGYTFSRGAVTVDKAREVVSRICKEDVWLESYDKHGELSYIPRKSGVRFMSQLPRYEFILLLTYKKDRHNLNEHTLELICRYFRKYYGSDWKNALRIRD